MSHINPQDELQQALEKKQKNSKDINRIMWIVLPILAFLVTGIIANLNIPSLILTYIVMLLAFVAVGIKQYSLIVVLLASLLYCLVDNYFSFHMQFNLSGLRNQLLMLLFILVVYIARISSERALMNKND